MYNATHTPLRAHQDLVTPQIEVDFNVDVAIVYATIEIMDSDIEHI